jgi:PPOX class probable F420-dependent enzyme
MAVDGLETAQMAVPDSHVDLLTGTSLGVLTTIGASGHPHSALVWVDLDDGYAAVNTTLERRIGRNLARNPRVSLLVIDTTDTSRFIEIRGDAELVVDGALDHLDRVTRRYTEHPCFYGYVYPVERAQQETRVVVRIHPRRIVLDAIHR